MFAYNIIDQTILLFLSDGPRIGSDRFSTLAKCNSLDAVTEEPELEDCTVEIRINEHTRDDDVVQMRPKEHNPPVERTSGGENLAANGKPQFTQNKGKAAKYGLKGMFGGGAMNGGGRTSSEDKPSRPLRSYSKIAQIFEEFSVSKIKVKLAKSNNMKAKPVVIFHLALGLQKVGFLIEPRREKTGFLHMRKQRRRSASQ